MSKPRPSEHLRASIEKCSKRLRDRFEIGASPTVKEVPLEVIDRVRLKRTLQFLMDHCLIGGGCTAERLGKGVGELRRVAESAGRDPSTIDPKSFAGRESEGVLYIPKASIAAEAAFRQVGPQLSEASRISGAGGARTMRRIILPLMLPGLAAGWALIFASIVGELTASVILAISSCGPTRPGPTRNWPRSRPSSPSCRA